MRVQTPEGPDPDAINIVTGHTLKENGEKIIGSRSGFLGSWIIADHLRNSTPGRTILPLIFAAGESEGGCWNRFLLPLRFIINNK